MEDAARTNFLDAERLTAPWPDERAHIYFKHAVFLLDLGTPQGLEASLSLFGRAAKECAKAVAKDLAKRVESLALAIRLNRADALSQLDRLGDADRELEAAGHDLGASPDVDELARIRLVRGYVAARRHDLGTAEVLFRQVGGALDGDYRARIALELARTYRKSHHLDQAEDRYRDAIEIIEEVRNQTNKVELRPWVLARRTQPYVELLELLVAQGRAVDALVIAESLHARAWQDVVLGRTDDHIARAQALTAARVRQRLHAAPTLPLDAKALMATIGDQEALVFLAIGPATWRAHIVHGRVSVERIPDDAIEVADQFRLNPDDPAAVERASGVLLPADFTVSPSPLYVVASGALAEVPFAALRLQGRYLIEDRPVARLPGLVALRCIASAWQPRAVVIGDSRGDLPEAAREVQQVAAATGAVPGVGSAALWSALVSAHGAQLLHIAAHGVPTPAGFALALADGNLTAADVLVLNLGPEVVVLTGCATASSDDAESWNGFPSAFLAAGSRYVIATLRFVEDAPAARVARAYYAQPASMSPIGRLAAAQRALVGVLSVKAWSSFAAWGSDACGASVRQNPTVGTK
jgi:hypothetical protein